jgi:16S rRNA (guanine527-N7)-methyltransferase
MDTETFKNRIDTACRLLNLQIDSGDQEKLLLYIDQLQRWNKTYNLTAIRKPEDMLIQHIFDSLAIIPSMDKILYKYTVNEVRIADIGSGAGLPGVVLAIGRKHWQVQCIDAVEKKMAFVRQVAGALSLPNLKAVHQRIENIGPLGAHIVVSRAFASLKDFARLAGEHVADGGWLLAMKGQQPLGEVAELQNETRWRVHHIEPLIVPELTAQRCLVWMQRQGNA